jgi:hypothetical protein
MVAAGNDDELMAIDCIDQSMGVIDASGPKACQVLFQGFWFANALKRGSLSVSDDLVDTFEGFSALGLPMEIIRPSLRGP